MSAKLKKSNSVHSPQAGLYLLFAELLHRELDPPLRKLLLQPDVLDVFVQIEPACAHYLGKTWNEDDYEQAAVDFCDLFIMPESGSAPRAAPRAAAWLEVGGALSAESVDAVVSQFITEWKIEVPPSYQYLAYDHIALILYLSVVIAEQDLALAEEFKTAVMNPWIGSFSNSLKNATSPVYSALGAMLLSI